MTRYTFDTLPIHPQPQPLESFCSYTMRLAAVNGIETLSHWRRLCYPSGQLKDSDFTHDAPPTSLGRLPELAACSEQSLQGTTFYHLAKKFGDKSDQLRTVNLFLKGSVAPYLRYCPHCLAEQNYYRLTWRFLALAGCPEHGCELCDRCGQCGQPIPLSLRLPGVGRCPHCGTPLDRGRSLPLDEQSWQQAKARERDLVYLLSPYSDETSAAVLKKQLGQQYAYRRLARQLKVADVARELGCSTSTVQALENKKSAHRVYGGNFCFHMAYADYLEVDFQTLFETLPPANAYEDILANQLDQIIAELHQTGQWATQAQLAQRLGLHQSVMRRYPKLKALWSDFLARRQQVRYAGLVAQIRQTATQIEQEGVPVSMNEISRRIGRSSSDMFQYPQTIAAMREVTGPAAQARSLLRREEQLLQLIKETITDLEARDERITKQALNQAIQLDLERLDRYPRIKAYLAKLLPLKAREYFVRQRQQRDAALLLLVQQGVKTLQDRGEPITTATICQIVNQSEWSLRSHPGVYAFTRQVVEEYRVRQRQQREADLLALVEQAVESLQAGEKPVTVRAICRIVGKTKGCLRAYPLIDTLLSEIVAANRYARTGD